MSLSADYHIVIIPLSEYTRRYRKAHIFMYVYVTDCVFLLMYPK